MTEKTGLTEQTGRDGLNEPFGQRIERLEHELALALRWDRPAILLTVYRSAFVRADAERALEAWLRERGQTVVRIEVRAPDDPAADLPRALAERAEQAGGRAIFFVSGLAQGAPTTWNSLNVRREYLVEGRVRAIFWLTEGEAAALPWQAPDFWSFRHRSVEFIEPPDMERAAGQAGRLAWEGFRERLPPGERRARIRLREDLLAELPDTPETAPTRAELHYTLGGLYRWDRAYEIAIRHQQKAIDLAEQLGNTQLQTWALNGLGNVYSALGRHDEAIAAYRRAIQLDPEDADYHNNLGNVYRALGRHDEAIAAYRRAIELDPEVAAPHHGLGNVYRALGQHDEAIAAYRRAVELDPESAFPHNGLGNVYYQQGRHDEAIAAYRRAVELDPDDAYPYNGLGNVYYQQGQHDEAIAAYRRAVELDPDFASPYNGLGSVYRHLGRHDEAIAAYRRAIELDPAYAYVHNNLGIVYRHLGRHDEAIAAYRRAIELDPEVAAPHVGLAGVYRHLGDTEALKQHVGRARELMADEDEYNQACIEAIAGDADAALDHLARALAHAPGYRDWARRDPDLETLHNHPRFQALVDDPQQEISP